MKCEKYFDLVKRAKTLGIWNDYKYVKLNANTLNSLEKEVLFFEFLNALGLLSPLYKTN